MLFVWSYVFLGTPHGGAPTKMPARGNGKYSRILFASSSVLFFTDDMIVTELLKTNVDKIHMQGFLL